MINAIVLSEHPQCFLTTAGRDEDDEVQICISSVAPGVRNPFTKARNLASMDVKYPVTICDACCARDHQEVFVFVRMDVQRRCVTWARHDLNDGVETIRVFRGLADEALLTGSRLHPFVFVCVALSRS